MLRLASVYFVATLTGVCGVSAAVVQSVNGTVLVNRGAGFKPVTGTSQLSAGDVVMAKEGSSANIVYADGCSIRVAPGTVASVSQKSGGTNNARVEESPCARGEVTNASSQTGGNTGGAGDPFALDTGLVVPVAAAGLIVGGIALAIIHNAASP